MGHGLLGGVFYPLLVALRSCTNLKTVFPSGPGLGFFTGDDGVLLQGGSRGS